MSLVSLVKIRVVEKSTQSSGWIRPVNSNLNLILETELNVKFILGPLFNVNAPAERLASGDAEYVEGLN